MNSSVEFERIFQEATVAANTAGDVWMNKMGNPSPTSMVDVCGIACILVKNQRDPFVRWLKQTNRITGDSIRLPYKYGVRQEWTLKEDCMLAAQSVFNSYGILTKFYSRID